MRLLLSSVLATSLLALAQTSDASAASDASDPTRFTDLDDAVQYPTANCDGLILLAPRKGTQFRDGAHIFPAGLESFFKRAAERNATWLTSLECSDLPSAIQSTRPPPVVDTAIATWNWAGFEQDGHAAHYAQAGWTVPTTTSPPIGHRYSSNGYESSIWAGIGYGEGSNIPPLIQAGTGQYVSTSNQTSYFFWYELLPTFHQISLAVSPGNAVASVVAWSNSTGTGTAYFGLCNESTNTCTAGLQASPVSAPSGSAEWIVEAPGTSSGIAALADFGTVSFHNVCYAQNYTPNQPVTCVAPSGPRSFYIQANVFGRLQALAIPQGNPGLSFNVEYEVPDNGQ